MSDIQERHPTLTATFDDPRLRMTVAGRIAVRIVPYIAYPVLAVLTALLLTLDVQWLFFTGVTMLLILGDRVIHRHEGDEPLSELPREGNVNIARYTTPAAFIVLERAYDRSLLSGRALSLQLIRLFLHMHNVRDAFVRLDVNPEEVRHAVEDYLARDEGVPPNRTILIAQAGELMLGAFRIAQGNDPLFIDADDLCAALFLSNDPWVKKILMTFGMEAQDVAEAIQFSYVQRQFRKRFRASGSLSGLVMGRNRGMRPRVMNRAWTARPTPGLDRASVDLTDLARRGGAGFLVGHDSEYARLLDALSRPTGSNALLVGDVGIGKETIVHHLAYELTKDRVPAPLFDRRLISLNLSILISDASPEELQGRLQQVVREITMAGNIILFIPDIHNLVKTSGTAYLSAADALLPLFMSNMFPIIGSSYPREFKEFIESRSDFVGAFEVIRVQEISEVEARKVLIADSALIEAQHNITVSFSAVKSAVALAKKYFHQSFLPASADILLKDAVALVVRNGGRIVKAADIIAVVEGKTKIPIHETTGDEAEKLLNLEDTIHKRLIGQEEAVKAVADALRQYRSGLARKGGPIASFLFVGPTGVGKTELAKILASIQFGSEKAMVRFDMTEYGDKQSFFRFIGSPDGSVHGALTDTILEKPHSLVLLDEFEKAYPDILNLFLQVMDDGRLTDNLGRTVDFTNTIIIATSNAHSDIINEALSKGESVADIADYLKKRLVDVFRPELLNRFSKIIIFRNLEPEHIKKIAALNLKDLAAMVSAQGITLTWDEAALKEVVRLGYDPAFGARPLRRVIDDAIKAPLAEKILKKEIERGGSLLLTIEQDKLILK